MSFSDASNVVAVDWETRAPWMDLMDDVRAHYAVKLSVVYLFDGPWPSPFLTEAFHSPDRELPDMSPAAIVSVTLRAEHLPQVHDLLHRMFWMGIDGLLHIYVLSSLLRC